MTSYITDEYPTVLNHREKKLFVTGLLVKWWQKKKVKRAVTIATVKSLAQFFFTLSKSITKYATRK